MRALLLALVCVCAAAPAETLPEASHWYGISPLRTTRREVERRLGRSKSPCRCVYEAPRERIYVKYSSGECTGTPQKSWRVPSDTVIGFQVYPKYKVKFSELELDHKAFVRQDTYELPGVFHYVNEKSGVSIEVDNDMVVSYNYEPSLADRHLRCDSSL